MRVGSVLVPCRDPRGVDRLARWVPKREILSAANGENESGIRGGVFARLKLAPLGKATHGYAPCFNTFQRSRFSGGFNRKIEVSKKDPSLARRQVPRFVG